MSWRYMPSNDFDERYLYVTHGPSISTNEFRTPGRNLALLFHGKENAITAQKLREGRTCLVTGYGNSMTPILESGDSVICEPVTEDTKLEKGDIVLCKVGGHYYLHKIVSIKHGNRYMIGNNHGHINGTIGRNNIFGLATEKL